MPFHRLFFLAVAVLFTAGAQATHNRAGEIIVCKVNDDPSDFWYEVRILTYTKLTNAVDVDQLELHWGDGQIGIIQRTSTQEVEEQDLRINEYMALHQYIGPGTYELVMIDPNRNGGVVNIGEPGSINIPFAIKTTFVISPQTGHNCSVRFLNPPIQDACINQPWVHNSVAYDPDGDSLSYEPAVCLGLNADPIPTYTFPGPNYGIDPSTGTITWNAPGAFGEYNIAFIVREWRLSGGEWYEVGRVTRDMQITVVPCDNDAPQVQEVRDTCVVANTTLAFNVQASDPDAGDLLTLTALGEPFVVAESPATFVIPSPGNPVNGQFQWNTACSHVRVQPYQVVLNVRDDNGEVILQDYSTMNIRVVAPAPENPLATPNGSAIDLSWEPSTCSNAVGYAIYRRSGLYGFEPDHCETGVPGYTGYSYLASTTGVNSTTHTDASGLVFGNQYCYLVVALFPDGAESYASVEFCAMLDRQVPVLTKVSVGVTDVTAGIDTVQWSNAYDLDIVARPGPYLFKLFRGTGYTTANELIYTSPLHAFLAHPDTTFIDRDIDTRTTAHVYRVEFFGDGGLDPIGSSNVASSVFIAALPNDEQLTIQWTANTPWINTLYEVFRFDGSDWVSIGTSTTASYTDAGLVNGQEYCYHVVSTGAYGDPDITAPLLNWSQEVCGVPVDLTPPCPPEVALVNDCELPLNTLTWNNPNNSCASDTYGYHIYFADSSGAPFTLIATITDASDTVFTHVNGSSVAGCYQVTAVDTAGNESAFITPVCGDNCPLYELPNIFTPNGDRANDLFGPFPYRGVRDIALEVFNRWGQVVHTATHPDIDWRGTYKDTEEPLPDGVYYYVCTVHFVRLSGLETEVLKGYVHIVGSGVPERLP